MVSITLLVEYGSTGYDMVANAARGELNRQDFFFPCPRSRLKIWSRETGSAVPLRVSLLILRLNPLVIVIINT